MKRLLVRPMRELVRNAGGTACATKATAAFAMVGQAVPPAQPGDGRFLLSFTRSRMELTAR